MTNLLNGHRRLVLFDMDGTLVDIFDAHHEGFTRGLECVYGATHTLPARPAFAWSVDLMRDICRRHGVSDAEFAARLPQMLAAKNRFTWEAVPERPAVLPGAHEVLQTLRDEGHVVALISGSARPTIERVLQRTGLDAYIRTYAGSDEAQPRVNLAHLALHRAAQEHGWTAPSSQITVVGDTANDVNVARALGARVVSLASGLCPADELATLEPDALLPGLGDWQRALRAILNGAAGAHP